jgi:DNA-binding NarL/FixJ family response regulator
MTDESGGRSVATVPSEAPAESGPSLVTTLTTWSADLPRWATRVLIVDDLASTRRFLREVLQDSPHFDIVGEAEDGGRAVEMADLLQPDLVLLDLGMPRMDGPAALAGLRAAAPLTKVVVLSGMNERVVLPLLAAGATAFLPKGIPPVELVERLTAILEIPATSGPGTGPHEPVPTAAPAPKGPRLRAIVCDDDPMARHLASQVLEECDVSVTAETASVPNLMSVVALTRPDIVVLDLWLEGTPGTTAPPQILAVSPDTIIVAFSAYEEWATKALAAGAAAFVVKPRFAELETKIRHLIKAAHP